MTADRAPRPRASQGSPAPTMADVAAHVGVSRTLVSMVIRGAAGPSTKSREKVLAAARELGYRPDIAARTLRGVAQRRIGVVFDIAQPFEVEIVEHIYRHAAELGFSVVVGPLTATRTQDVVLGELLGYRAEALVVIAPSVDLASLDALQRRLRVPVVEVGRRSSADGLSVVRTDDADGLKQSVDHLVALGHRAIAHVDGGDRPGARERREGYRRRMRHHRLDDFIDVVPGDYTEEAGARAAKALLGSARPPTAIIAANDRAAIGVLGAVREAGLAVPTDISVVGFDDSTFARLAYIGLTTIKQDASQMARYALDDLLVQLDDPEAEGRRVVLAPTLIVRSSTGPPPSSA